LQAFHFLAERRRQHELGEQLYTNALAAHGDGKAINKQLKEWDS
jgi:hypothetical protein